MINDDATPTPDDDSIPNALPDGPLDYEPTDEEMEELDSGPDMSESSSSVIATRASSVADFKAFLIENNLAPSDEDPVPVSETSRIRKINCSIQETYGKHNRRAGWYVLNIEGAVAWGACGCGDSLGCWGSGPH